MEDTRVARRQEEEEEEVRLVSSDSAYGSSAMDTDTEDGQTPTDTTWPYNEDITHKTILVGDSGVGKTSLLVQYDQGKFLPGSFTATVGIGFTGGRRCMAHSVCRGSVNSGFVSAASERQQQGGEWCGCGGA
ncbi:uncharacterized protein AB9X84_003687 [Acanthopagrus schlegelii]